MIESATGWIELVSVSEARADLVPNQVDLDWLTKKPLAKKLWLIETKTSQQNSKLSWQMNKEIHIIL